MGGLEKCQEVMGRIAEQCDVLVGNEEDLQLGLGVKGNTRALHLLINSVLILGPDVEKDGKLDHRAFFGIIDAVVKKFPNIKVVSAQPTDHNQS